MKCPTCVDTTLTMTVREQVEIDYCPQCRGVWLDRGELDKLIQRSESTPQSSSAQRPARDRPDFVDSDHQHPRRDQGRRTKSWLGEIFD